MKKAIIFLAGCLLSLFSCKDSYKMPYEPGVTVDQESLNDRKDKWIESNITNYSYTYLYKSGISNKIEYEVNVIVQNNVVTNYILLNYNGKTETSCDNTEWSIYLEDFSNQIKNTDSLLIENIYSSIEEFINNSLNQYKQNKDCYYANFDFNFSDNEPFISTIKIKTVLMEKELNGNGSNIEIEIKDFVKE